LHDAVFENKVDLTLWLSLPGQRVSFIHPHTCFSSKEGCWESSSKRPRNTQRLSKSGQTRSFSQGQNVAESCPLGNNLDPTFASVGRRVLGKSPRSQHRPSLKKASDIQSSCPQRSDEELELSQG